MVENSSAFSNQTLEERAAAIVSKVIADDTHPHYIRLTPQLNPIKQRRSVDNSQKKISKKSRSAPSSPSRAPAISHTTTQNALQSASPESRGAIDDRVFDGPILPSFIPLYTSEDDVAFSEERYYERDDFYTSKLRKNPNDITLVINYAFEVRKLHEKSFLNDAYQGVKDLNNISQDALNRAASRLQEALYQNTESALLWRVYINTLIKQGADNSVITTEIENALDHVRSSYSLWELYIRCSETLDKKIEICDRAIDAFVRLSEGMK